MGNVKVQKNSLTEKWSTYPVLKLFKGNSLIEIGYNNITNWDVHLMYRFLGGIMKKLFLLSIFTLITWAENPHDHMHHSHEGHLHEQLVDGKN